MDITVIFEVLDKGGAVGVACFLAWWAWNERKSSIKQTDRFLDLAKSNTESTALFQASLVIIEKKLDHVEQAISNLKDKS